MAHDDSRFTIHDSRFTIHGFTLLELIVVITVIGILVAFTLPEFRGTYEHLRFKNSADNFIELVRYGQDLAVLHVRTYRVVVDQRDGAYWLERERASGSGFESLAGRWGKKIRVPGSVEMEADEKYYNFFADGRVESGEIKFERSKHYSLTVKLSAVRGQIDVEEERESRR